MRRKAVNLILGVLIITLAGCAVMEKANIKGKDIYIGMSQQNLELALGAPDRSVSHMNTNGNGRWYSQYYGNYQINVADGVVTYIDLQ